MDGAGRGDEINIAEAVEHAAARFLAAGFGHGLAWWANASTEPLMLVDEDGIPHENLEAVPMARETETVELAGKAINAKWRPAWFRRLPASKRAQLLAWNNTHHLSRKRGDGIGEFQQWEKNPSFGSVPSRDGSRKAAAALADARLGDPLEPLLRLYALQDVSQWPIVKRCLVARGFHPHACEVAIRKVLFDYIRIVNVDDEARGHNKAKFRAWVHDAERTLHRWLRKASWRFMRAHGWTPDTYVTEPQRTPRRSLPRFQDGIDWQTMPPLRWARKDNKRIGEGKPEPCLVLSGESAVAHCLAYPSAGHLSRTYLANDDSTIHDLWDRRGREKEFECEQQMAERLTWERDAVERDAEIPSEGLY